MPSVLREVLTSHELHDLGLNDSSINLDILPPHKLDLANYIFLRAFLAFKLIWIHLSIVIVIFGCLTEWRLLRQITIWRNHDPTEQTYASNFLLTLVVVFALTLPTLVGGSLRVRRLYESRALCGTWWDVEAIWTNFLYSVTMLTDVAFIVSLRLAGRNILFWVTALVLGLLMYAPRIISGVVFLDQVHTANNDRTPSSIINCSTQNESQCCSSNAPKKSRSRLASIAYLYRTLKNINGLGSKHAPMCWSGSGKLEVDANPQTFKAADNDKNMNRITDQYNSAQTSENMPDRSTLIACDALGYSYLFILVYLRILIFLKIARSRVIHTLRIMRRVCSSCLKQPLKKVISLVRLLTTCCETAPACYEEGALPPEFTLLHHRTLFSDTRMEAIAKLDFTDSMFNESVTEHPAVTPGRAPSRSVEMKTFYSPVVTAVTRIKRSRGLDPHMREVNECESTTDNNANLRPFIEQGSLVADDFYAPSWSNRVLHRSGLLNSQARSHASRDEPTGDRHDILWRHCHDHALDGCCISIADLYKKLHRVNHRYAVDDIKILQLCGASFATFSAEITTVLQREFLAPDLNEDLEFYSNLVVFIEFHVVSLVLNIIKFHCLMSPLSTRIFPWDALIPLLLSVVCSINAMIYHTFDRSIIEGLLEEE